MSFRLDKYICTLSYVCLFLRLGVCRCVSVCVCLWKSLRVSVTWHVWPGHLTACYVWYCTSQGTLNISVPFAVGSGGCDLLKLPHTTLGDCWCVLGNYLLQITRLDEEALRSVSFIICSITFCLQYLLEMYAQFNECEWAR